MQFEGELFSEHGDLRGPLDMRAPLGYNEVFTMRSYTGFSELFNGVGELDYEAWMHHLFVVGLFGYELDRIEIVGVPMDATELDEYYRCMQRHFVYTVKLCYRTKYKHIFNRDKIHKTRTRRNSF